MMRTASIVALGMLVLGAATVDAEARKGRPLPEDPNPRGVFLDGVDDTSSTASIELDGVEVVVSSRPADDEAFEPIFSVHANGNQVLEVVGAISFFQFLPVTARLVQVDPSTPQPEAILTSYTGGAHCCEQIELAYADGNGSWQTIDLGAFDGGYMFEDDNGDGIYEIAVFDQSFLYTFDCYACSWPPKRYYQLQAGELIDVSTDPSFHAAFASEVGDYVPEEHVDEPGSLAGWAAHEARLGRGQEALERLSSMNAATEFSYEVCASGGSSWDCAPKAIQQLSFVDFLRRHLVEHGYMDGAS